MKKVLGIVACLLVVTAIMSSCKVHKGCDAYSKVDVKKSAHRI